MANYLSVDEAARYLKVSILDLLDLERTREIEAFAGNDGSWYFRKENLDEYLIRSKGDSSEFYTYEEFGNGTTINIPPTPRIKIRHAFPSKHNHLKVTLDIESDKETIAEVDIKTKNENTSRIDNKRLDKLIKYFTYFLVFFLAFDFVMFVFYLILTSK